MGERDDEDAIRTRLEASLGPVLGTDLAAHLRRGGVLIVQPDRALIECAIAIARDDVARVRAWLDEGALRVPTADEVSSWPTARDRTWLAVVVQPYVLVQDPPS